MRQRVAISNSGTPPEASGFSAEILLATLLERSRLPQALGTSALQALHEAYQTQSEFKLHMVWNLSLSTGADAIRDTPELDFRAAFDEILPYWVGPQGRQPARAADIGSLKNFLEAAEVGGNVWSEVVEYLEANAAAARKFEIFSLAELAVLSRYLPRSRRPLKVLEVGGGFGRLGHVFLSLKRPVIYVNSDLVPESLIMSTMFLEENHRDASVSLALTPEAVADFFAAPLVGKRALIVPAWHAFRIPEKFFDIGINIASFQGMDEKAIALYILLFESSMKKNSIFVSHNSRDYPYPKELLYPPDWRLLYKNFSLRSFSGDYPLEIFRVTTRPMSRSTGESLEGRYNASLVPRYRAEFALLAQRLKDRTTTVRQLRERIAELIDEEPNKGSDDRTAAAPAAPALPAADPATEGADRVRLRRFPFPFRAMLAICSDIDLMTARRFAALHRFLNTKEETPLGQGLGLDISDSFWFYAPSDPLVRQMAFFDGLDWRRQSACAGHVLEYIRAGWIDTLHSYGNFSILGDGGMGFTREHAERALAVLGEEGLAVPVWVNHGNRNNTQNIGRQHHWVGDRPGHPCWHSDLLVQSGTTFLWSGEISETFRCDSAVCQATLRDGQTVWQFVRQDFAFRDDADDLAKQFGAVTRLRDGRACAMLWHPRLLHLQIAADNLADLAVNGGYAIIGQHLGFPSQRRILPAQAVNALYRLKDAQDRGEILVARTSRLLRYAVVRDHLRFETTIDAAGKTIIDLLGIDDPVDGARAPTVDQLRGVGFEIDGEGPVILRLRGRVIASSEMVEHRLPGMRVVGIKWFEPDYADYTNCADYLAGPRSIPANSGPTDVE